MEMWFRAAHWARSIVHSWLSVKWRSGVPRCGAQRERVDSRAAEHRLGSSGFSLMYYTYNVGVGSGAVQVASDEATSFGGFVVCENL